MLQSDIPHAEQQGGYQGNDHEKHRALHIHGIPDMAPLAGHMSLHEQKGIESFKTTVKPLQLPSFFEMGLYLLNNI
jgi:hypothetical protein